MGWQDRGEHPCRISTQPTTLVVDCQLRSKHPYRISAQVNSQNSQVMVGERVGGVAVLFVVVCAVVLPGAWVVGGCGCWWVGSTLVVVVLVCWWVRVLPW